VAVKLRPVLAAALVAAVAFLGGRLTVTPDASAASATGTCHVGPAAGTYSCVVVVDPPPSPSAAPSAVVTPSPPTPSPTAQPTPAPTPSPSPTPSPTAAPTAAPTPTAAVTGTYGPGIGADSLANTQLGGTSCGCANSQSAYHFRASASGPLTSARFYIVDGSGYAGGTGGTIRVMIEPDAGGVPSGTALTSTTFTPGNPVKIGYLPAVTFSSPAMLTAGTLYDLVFMNVDAAPKTNYMSLDGLFTFANEAQPGVAADWKQLINTGVGWFVRPNYNPILDLTIGGSHQGMGYMEVWVNAPTAIGGANEVREQFTASRTVTVNQVMLRAAGSAVTASLAGQTAIIPVPSSIGWATGTLAAPVTLVAGTAYQLVFTSTGTASTWGIERGSGYSFSPLTYFNDGFGQFSTNGGSTWSGFNQPGGSKNNTNADAQFYLK
jgi:hypothetical protein